MSRKDVQGADELPRRFGQTMVLIRGRAGLSQEEVGFRASLHRTEIGMLERGIRMPRLDTIVKIAGALEVAPGDLLVGMAWSPGHTKAGGFRLPDDPA
jgi:transcriptional regulator with XRE-family HTH domain